MIKEIKEYFKTVDELKVIHQEIENNTRKAYEEFLESLIFVSNLWANGADEDYRSKYPVFATKEIEKANPDDFKSTVVKNLINERPCDETLRYKYIYIGLTKKENPVIVDLELLRELFLKDDIRFTIKYDEYQEAFEFYYDTICISMYYKDLEEFLKGRTSTK